jgi:hypothetical protein
LFSSPADFPGAIAAIFRLPTRAALVLGLPHAHPLSALSHVPVLCDGIPPSRQTSAAAFGNAIFVAFALVQCADGILTYFGIIAFGTSIEANPLIEWSVAAFGAGTALITAKAVAVGCAMVLHLTARHYIMGALTIAYLLTAIWPWTRLFWF